MDPYPLAGALLLAYLFGAVPFGVLLGKAAGVDVRGAGSGNIGATNVARTAGKGLGLLTLLLDAIKGATPVLIGRALELPVEVVAGLGFAAVVGHIFPVYLRFRGGKGVATALGVFLALAPAPSGVAVLAFALVFAVSRTVSLGSMVGAVSLVAATELLDGRRPVVALAGAVTLLIVVRHAGNIQRLLARREHRL